MKTIRKIVLFIAVLCIGILFRSESAYSQTYSETDDPEYWKAQGYIADEFYDNVSEDVFENDEFGISAYAIRSPYTRRLGVDVSKYQGNIDWAKAKAQGVEFAIIRVGYRGSGSGTLNEDPYYIKNITGALQQGIRVGVYFFSQAITEAEAIEEAKYVISRIYKYNITLPVVIDYEYTGSNGTDGRLYNAHLSREQATAVCKAFCRTVQNSGYTGMLYANKYMLTSKLNAEEIAADYRIWLAHYTSATNYSGTYDFWQFTSTGNGYTYGMQSQYVDLDYWYDDGTIYGKDYSSVFDAAYYANKYSDLKSAYGNDTAALLSHFLNNGMKEKRQGSENFNVLSYGNAYKDLRDAYGSDSKSYYLHYIDFGKNEGRVGTGYETKILNGKTVYQGVDYSSVYDVNYYLNNNQDLLNAFGYDEHAAIAHFVNSGMKEGRQGCATFNVQSYKNTYKDLRECFGDDLKRYYLHYINYGRLEGRTGTGNETKIVNAITVYNGVDYSGVYDANFYLQHNPDLLKAFGYDEKRLLAHFVNHGMREGRLASRQFDVYTYKNRYSDLRNAYGNNLECYYIHYINYGRSEGRIAF